MGQHRRTPRHGDERFRTAFTAARKICNQYRDSAKMPAFFDSIQHRWNERRQRLGVSQDWLAVRYPEIIAVTSVLCSDYWLTAAATPYRRPPMRKQRPDCHDFILEVARRLRHHDPVKLVKSGGSTIGEYARKLQPPAPKLRYGYYPEKGQIS